MTKPRGRVNKDFTQKEIIEVRTEPKKVNQNLPSSIRDTFDQITDTLDRDEYIRRLRAKGWTLQSVAECCGLTRERVRQLCAEENVESDFVDGLDLPELPKRTITKTIPKQIDPEVAERLLELKFFASQVRSNSPQYREEAEEFTALINQQMLEGISIVTLGKTLGVTHAAILSRLVRYGYRKINSDSRMFQPIKNRA
jgi:transcriptional regulator with XRE-family HTH domain